MKETFTLNKKLGEALNNKKLVYYQDCPFIVDKRINWIAAEEFFTLIGYEKKPKKWDKRPGYNGWEKEEGSFCQNLIPSDGNCDRIEDWEDSLEFVGDTGE